MKDIKGVVLTLIVGPFATIIKKIGKENCRNVRNPRKSETVQNIELLKSES